MELAILEPDRSRCMVLAITELKASLKSGGNGTINALLGGIKLADQTWHSSRRGATRAADTMQLARTAFEAYRRRLLTKWTPHSVLAVRSSVPTPSDDAFHSDIDVEFATLRLAVGAIDLKPLGRS